MTLVEKCYSVTRHFPYDERFGLTAQMRRAAVSIPLNVAEGACRHSTSVYINHLSIALGSHGELETCVEISRRLGYLSTSSTQELMSFCDPVGRLLNGLLRSLQASLLRTFKDFHEASRHHELRAANEQPSTRDQPPVTVTRTRIAGNSRTPREISESPSKRSCTSLY
jgi:four helix bundle protein